MFIFAFLQRVFSLASLALLAAGAWLLWRWWELERSAAEVGLEESAGAYLAGGLALLFISLFGRSLVLLLLGKTGEAAPERRGPASEVLGADGARLHVEREGADEGPVLVFTHGWGLSSRVWAEARRDLGSDFGLVLWDLPGSGRSGRPTAGWSIEGFAEDLNAVIDSVPAHRPVVLVGHSIGGMTTLTFAARHTELLNARVAGLVLLHTTHTNPLRTMVFAKLLKPLQPLIEAGCRGAVVFSPLLWIMNWQAYLSGATHMAARIAAFGQRPLRAHLDRTARLPTKTSPGVQARGNLAMMRWSVTERLEAIDTPVLIFAGGRDLITKDHAGEQIARALPRAELVRLEHAGHMGLLEYSDDCHRRIAEFVRRLPLVQAASG